jgi:hypothetical protein
MPQATPAVINPAAGISKAAPTDVNSINENIIRLAVNARQSSTFRFSELRATSTSVSGLYTNLLIGVRRAHVRLAEGT